MRLHPLAGPAREALAPGLRAVFHGRYAIYYLPRPDEILLVRVLHGARDLAALRDELRRQVPGTDTPGT